MALVVLDLRSTVKAGVANDPTPGMGLFIEQGHLWLGPWQWHTTFDGDEFWGAPLAIDPLNYVNLGSDPLARMSRPARRGLERRMGYADGSLPDSHLADILAHYILGALADPTGQSRVKPLRMGRRGLKLYLGSFGLVLEEDFSRNHPNFDATLAVRHADYRRNKGSNIPLEALQRWTGHDMQTLYGRVGDDLLDELVPAEFIQDGWSRPRTTITESFNTADSDTLGPDLAWTEVHGDFDILNNQARIKTRGTDSARAESDLSGSDMYASADIIQVDTNAHVGTAVRFSPTEGTYYTVFYADASGNERVQPAKVVTDTRTELGSGTAGALTAPFEVKTQIDGDTLTGHIDSVQQVSVTDTSITGNLRAGLYGLGSFTPIEDWNNFEAADLGGAPAGSPHSQAVIIG